MSQYFYLSEEEVEHERHLFTFLNLLSEIGGLIPMIFKLLGVFGRFINYKFLFNKLIRAMYHIQLKRPGGDGGEI